VRKRIVLATWGSLGDLYPYVAVALGLRCRGHGVTLASSEHHRTTVENAGLPFHPLPPDVQLLLNSPELLNCVIHAKNGFEHLSKKVLLPSLRESYESLLTACKGADLLISNDLTYAAPLVAEHLGLPWISSALQPQTLGHFREPSFLSTVPIVRIFYNTRRAIERRLKRIRSRAWARPIRDLRAHLGLRAAEDCDPSGAGFSQLGTLALFSRVLGPPQAGWPPHTQVTGFPFPEVRTTSPCLDDKLERFLGQGDRPVVFTLGSAVVQAPGKFFATSLAAVNEVGCRAVMLVGPRYSDAGSLAVKSKNVYITDYVAFHSFFPRVAALVHAGGIGTLAYALHASLPMLIVPHSFDQPDNAKRAASLGVARTMTPKKYRVARVASELGHLLSSPSYKEAAKTVGQSVREEDGVGQACLAVENCCLS
jgi:rhamnosyltransferase subunit B